MPPRERANNRDATNFRLASGLRRYYGPIVGTRYGFSRGGKVARVF